MWDWNSHRQGRGPRLLQVSGTHSVNSTRSKNIYFWLNTRLLTH
jgi:hypothetical protein